MSAYRDAQVLQNILCLLVHFQNTIMKILSSIQSNYKLFERLHKFSGKKIIATQKLSSHQYACVQNIFVLLFAMV
jgi:hypothetical protein